MINVTKETASSAADIIITSLGWEVVLEMKTLAKWSWARPSQQDNFSVIDREGNRVVYSRNTPEEALEAARWQALVRASNSLDYMAGL